MDNDQLNRLIDGLETAVDSAKPFKTKWHPIWEEIKQISAGFKQVRYPSKQERQEKWEHFQTLVQEVKALQSEEQDKWEQKSYTSTQHKNEILSFANAATPAGPLSDFIISLVTLPARPILAALDALLPGGEYDEKHHELKACSSKLHQGWDLFAKYKDEMTGRDKKEVFQALKDAQDSLNDAWENWKRAKSQAREARADHFRAKREAFQSGVRDRIENLKERLEKSYSILSKCESHLDELRDKRDSAWNDSFRDRVEGWIDEEEDRIASIKEKIDRIEGWLDEERNKLR